VFVVDDDQIYVYTLKKLITGKNLCNTIVEFSNGKEAFDYLVDPANANNLPEIIFLDINMPVMDGWDFIALFGEIKSRLSKNITVYMVSSSVSKDDIARSQSFSDITEYISKPLSTSKLIEAFERAA
jgi:CheY-like chemotaxis protein